MCVYGRRSCLLVRGVNKGSSKLTLIHISEPTRQAEISYAVFCLKKKKKKKKRQQEISYFAIIVKIK